MKRPSILVVWDGHWGAESSVAWVVYQTLWRSLPVTKPTSIIQHHKPKKERYFYIWYQLIFNWSSTAALGSNHPPVFISKPPPACHAAAAPAPHPWPPAAPASPPWCCAVWRRGATRTPREAAKSWKIRMFLDVSTMVTRWCPRVYITDLNQFDFFKLSWSYVQITLVMGLAGPCQGIAIMEMGLQTDAGFAWRIEIRGYPEESTSLTTAEPSNTHSKMMILWHWRPETGSYPYVSYRRTHEQIEQNTETPAVFCDVCGFETKDYMIRRSPSSLQIGMGARVQFPKSFSLIDKAASQVYEPFKKPRDCTKMNAWQFSRSLDILGPWAGNQPHLTKVNPAIYMMTNEILIKLQLNSQN